MKGSIHLLDETGDTLVEWDTEKKDEADEAVRRFEELRTRHQLAWAISSVEGESKPENIALKPGDFDPEVHTKVVMSPAFQGG